MNKIISTACSLLLLMAVSSHAAEKNKLFEEWVVRGKKGAARVDELLKTKKLPSGKSEMSDSQLCELFIESAFAKFDDPKFLDVVKKRNGEIDSYSLLIQSMDGKSTSQLAFFYPSDKSRLVAITAFRLASEWRFSATNEGLAVFEGEGCRYFFQFKSPLEPKVTTYKR